jgi:hypothetical protein
MQLAALLARWLPGQSRSAVAGTERCFVCNADLGESSTATMRFACPTCKARARLVSSDVPLDTLLRSTRPDPLEGSGLNALLGPVQIDGHRGWCDFAMGGHAVLQEIFPSRDYFDFMLQHAEPWAGVMRALRATPAVPADAGRIEALIRQIPQRGPGIDNLEWLDALWGRAEAAAAVLAVTPPLASNEAVWQAAERALTTPSPATPARRAAMLTRLGEIAERTALP